MPPPRSVSLGLRRFGPGAFALIIGACASSAAWADGQTLPVAVPEPSSQALRFYHSGNWLWALGQVWLLAVLLLWLFTGAAARLRDVASRLSRGRYLLSVALFAGLFVLITAVVELPLGYYRGFVRMHAYGLSNQTFTRWANDWLISHGVAVLLAMLVAPFPFWLLRRTPKRWWLYCWMLSVPFSGFVMLVKPVWYDPLFNHFGRMENRALEHDILSLAHRAGIRASRVYQVDMSNDTRTLNAYVTGLAGTHRIVLWDTLLRELNEPEILFVMGHEMGHYVLGHVERTLLLVSVANLLGFWLVNRLARGVTRRCSRRLAFDGLDDPAALPLLLLLAHVLTLASTPIALLYSRAQEHEADRFAIEITHLNRAGALGFARMMENNLSNPWPGWFYRTWRASHPSIGERIGFCNAYRPWERGQPSRYAPLFQEERPPYSQKPPEVRATAD